MQSLKTSEMSLTTKSQVPLQLSILSIDARQMAIDGHLFYRSPNGVWLTDQVLVGYFQLCKAPVDN